MKFEDLTPNPANRLIFATGFRCQLSTVIGKRSFLVWSRSQMAALHSADQDLLQKLLLGQLSTADVERLATEYADDGRLAELAESLAGKGDALLDLLHNHETAVVDPDGERLVERLLERLKPALPDKPRDDTAAMRLADASTEPSSPDLNAPPPKLPERLEHYRPIKVLGQGGMGTVYLAEDTRLGREVAIKTLRPELASNPQFKERFLREARSAAKLEHDNIIPIYSVGEADGTPFLAMPLLKGEPLDALIRRTAGPLPVAMAVRLAREVAAGLAAAHARGLIHRDIKPANIWLEAPTGRVKILDFGLAKTADAGGEADSETNLTASGAIVGTPAFMAPEQAGGHSVDGRADLFSLGCVLYQLLSGQRAFTGSNTMAILMSLANHTPTAPDKLSSQCPPALSRLVMQLLEKDPAKRPASAEAVIEALDNLEIASVQANGAASAPWSSTDIATTGGLTPPRSPIHVEPTQSDAPRPGDSSLTLPATAVFPVRKRAIPKPRVALALAGALLIVAAVFGIIKISTPDGDYVIQTDDPDFSFSVSKSVVTLRDKKTTREYTMKVVRQDNGVFELDVTDVGADLSFKTKKFTIKRGQQVALKAHFERKPADVANGPPSADPDRRIAELILRIGGGIELTAGDRYLGSDWKLGALPAEPFQVYSITFTTKVAVDDQILDQFHDLRGLQRIALHDQPITDAGLSRFLASPAAVNLRTINFLQGNIGDAGFEPLANLRSLTDVSIRCPKITNATVLRLRDLPVTVIDIHSSFLSADGLAALKDKKLTTLTLSCPKVDDRGMEFLKETTTLVSLGLHFSGVSDAGIAHLASNAGLVGLALQDSKVTAAGIDQVARFRKLIDLNLSGLPMSDNELETLKTLSELKILRLARSKVTEAGVKKLSAALPGCRIEWDGGVIEPSPSTNPDRRAAEWVLSIGGNISIKENGQERGIGAVGDLPRGAFELTVVDLDGNQKVSDAGLAVFKDCKNMTQLHLGDTVSDAGLAHFKDCKNLTHLWLAGKQVSDVGLAHFKGCQNMTQLHLGGTQVSDLGLAHFKDCQNLTALALSWTKVSDAGLAHFKDCKNLTDLHLGGTPVSDAGLAHFKDCKNLAFLDLHYTQVSDAGLVHFQDCKNLTHLSLSGIQASDAQLAYFKDCKNLKDLSLSSTLVSDAGLAYFQNCKNLTDLHLANTQVSDAGLNGFAGCPKLGIVDVKKTKVTEAGVKKLSAALPGCKIEWDGGVIEPRSVTPDRRAAEYVVSIGGSITIKKNGQERQAGAEGELPRGAFELEVVSLYENQKVNDVGLAQFNGCQNLRQLDLGGTQVTDAGLAHFKQCKKLTSLGLINVQVSDAGLAHFDGCHDITQLYLGNTKLSDAGLAHFKDCKNLQLLHLGNTNVSDVGLTNFKDCKNVSHLDLRNTKVSDAGLANFRDCQNLTSLQLYGPLIHDAGLAHFKDCKDLTLLDLYATQVSDAGLAHFAGCPKLGSVIVKSTKVTEAGVKKLSAALPGCKIVWDGGVIEPSPTDPDRRAAEWMLSGFGVAIVNVDKREFEVREVANLPKGAFRLIFGNMSGNTRLSDEGLAHFKDCKNLRTLQLIRASVRDAWLVHFKNCTALVELDLSGTSISDAGLAHFKDCQELARLNLNNTQVSDASLEQLADFPKLVALNVKSTKVTEAGVKKLSAALPGCKIEWDGGVIEPSKSN